VAGYIVHQDEARLLAGSADTVETIAAGRSGYLAQHLVHVSVGESRSGAISAGTEEILYVTGGCGTLELDHGAHIAEDESYSFAAVSDGDRELVSVLAPISASSGVELGERRVIVRLADQPSLSAGKDRSSVSSWHPSLDVVASHSSWAGFRQAGRAITITRTTRSSAYLRGL